MSPVLFTLGLKLCLTILETLSTFSDSPLEFVVLRRWSPIVTSLKKSQEMTEGSPYLDIRGFRVEAGKLRLAVLPGVLLRLSTDLQVLYQVLYHIILYNINI